MYEFYPLVVTGAIVGLFSIVLLAAYLSVKDKKQSMGFERQMGDREIMGRLMHYAKPYRKQFALVGGVMLFSIAYDILYLCAGGYAAKDGTENYLKGAGRSVC